MGRLAILVLLSLTVSSGQNFTAAKIVLNDLTLFPMQGAPITISLPSSVRTSLIAPGYPDGKSIYLAVASPLAVSGISKIDFKPLRLIFVAGSEGFGRVNFLTVAPSGKLYVSGCRKDRENWECGVFEIDPVAETARPLQTNIPNRQHRDISPDGRYVLVYDGDAVKKEPLKVGVLNLANGNVRSLKDASGGSWSPDGRWLAVVRNNRLELLDATT